MSDHTWIDDGDEQCFVCHEDVSDCECTDAEIEAFFDRVTHDYFHELWLEIHADEPTPGGEG